jgi:uncharacterized protein
MSAQLVHDLSLDALQPATLHKLQLELAHDSLGRPIRLPIIVAKGRRPGPVFGITAAVHGNELNGIPVVQRLTTSLDLNALRGTVVGVVVMNIPGYLANERQFLGTWDLNHLFPGKVDGNAAEVYVYRFVERVVRHFDALADLHTASFGRVNSLYIRADMTHPVVGQMAHLMRPQIIVHNPPNDKTLRGHADTLNIPSMTVEIGNPQRFNGDFIRRTMAGLRRVMAQHGMVKKRTAKVDPCRVLCRRSRWMYTDKGGLLDVFPTVTERVKKGDVVAELRDPWGDLVATYKAPNEGIVIGRNVNPVASTGARILHLGRVADDDDPRFIRNTA